ncbi:FAD-dependent oxidoreductase [Streptomyces sp. CO7]
MARVAVTGGGISGLGTALMLGRRGHSVVLFERDPRLAAEDLDDAFFGRFRPRVPQAAQPHSLPAPVRIVVRAEAPDVHADLLRRGAREYCDFDWFPERPPYRAGDEDLVTLRTRRIVLEAALTAAVRREPRAGQWLARTPRRSPSVPPAITAGRRGRCDRGATPR